MKKIVLLIVCVLAMMGAMAQSHSFRDTSYVRYEQLDIDSWLLSDSMHRYGMHARPLYPGTTMLLGTHDVLQYNYTNKPEGVRVVGLSALISTFQLTLYYPMVPSEYLLLYDAENDTFDLKGQLQWEASDTAGRPHYGGVIWGVRDGRVVHWTDIHGHTVPDGHTLFDLYFDNPITVHDSFYVGGTCRNHLYPFGSDPINESSYVTYSFEEIVGTGPAVHHYPGLWKIFNLSESSGPGPYNQWVWVPSDQFMMVMPIIEVVDTSFDNAPKCYEVTGLLLRGNYTDTVTVQWAQDSLHQEFEVSYGREGTRPDDGTIVTVIGSNRWMFSDSAYSDTPMVVYVRTVCREYDTLRWSGWSYPIHWQLHYESGQDTTQHEGIAVPEEEGDLSRFVRLMPNPASGSVVVMSSYGIESLEVYDVRGERVLEQKGSGHGTATGFDVSKWAKGVYVVLVRTPAGTASKRLVVK